MMKKKKKKLKLKYPQFIPKVSNHNKLVYLIRLGFCGLIAQVISSLSDWIGVASSRLICSDKNILWFFVSSGRNGKRCKTWTFALSSDFDDFTDCRFHRFRRRVYSNEHSFRSWTRSTYHPCWFTRFLHLSRRKIRLMVSINFTSNVIARLFRLDSHTSKHKSFCEMEKDGQQGASFLLEMFSHCRLSKWVICWLFIFVVEEFFFFFFWSIQSFGRENFSFLNVSITFIRLPCNICINKYRTL